ncbi:HEAT repeat domain-containing protein [Lampropedia aestuarii]|uniref:HEAT repeat domain-containing protein n=1 Tax=Lampropedia aestuarii TaxID=2562762 RepID=A0A4V3YXL8_9BURK|nr:HEAT repeat domain-containing protein [Lampropedia aestuarii]MDH5855891.1 HEAT repeat domain-containing protein [Lampropedia aestuarii]THJ35602.1 HEAT repeat domain-containing protein [Lampropedia aestuarii]
MIDSQTWIEITRDLASKDVDIAVAACEALHALADQDDVPRLLGLLADPDFFIREAAAWPLTELAGADALPQLLIAFQRGYDEGHDNDGFSTALLQIPALFPESKTQVAKLLDTAEGSQREHLIWLMDFY